MWLPKFGIWDAVDIGIVAFLVYRLILLVRGTRALQLIKGLAVLLVVSACGRWLNLRAVNWLLQRAVTMVFVGLPIVFLPELRRALEQMGRGRLFLRTIDDEAAMKVMAEVVRSADLMSRSRTGALIVMENGALLTDVAATGTAVDSAVTAEILATIFHNGTPLHDGAALIRGDRVLAAGCLLPLTDDSRLSKSLGTRHRAAIGISEQTDAVVVVVSEETGTISLASGGQMERHLTRDALGERLAKLSGAHQSQPQSHSIFRWGV